MVRRMKHGPVNAATVLPVRLLKALQRHAAGRQVYIPATESPAARRWREAYDYHRQGHDAVSIARRLEIHPRYVAQLLAAPPPPPSRAQAVCFAGPKGRALLSRIRQHVEACVLYVPVIITAATKRRRRIHRLFTLGWTPARVATHLHMNAQYVGRLFRTWRALHEAEGRTVVVGQPLYSAADRRQAALARERRQRQRRMERAQRADASRRRALFGEDVEMVNLRPLVIDRPDW